MMRLAILGSTRGTNMDAIVEAIKQGQLAATIEIVLSDRSTAYILERARSYGLRSEFVNSDGLSRESYDLKMSDILTECHVDLIVLVGYMRILSSAFVERWKNKIINVHPSLLPAHAGKMDMDVHKAVLQEGDKETGCSVHYVIEQVDAGPVIIQKKCPVLTLDSPQNLKDRVQKLEGIALIEAIAKIS